MKIIPPLTINDMRLTAASVPEPDASMGEIAWTPSTAYAIGDVRIRTQTHRRYQALVAIANTVTTPPENDPTRWADIGPTNRYAAFDYERNTSTAVSNGTSLTFQVTPGVRSPALCLFGLKAEVVRVMATSGGMTVYDRTLNLTTRFTTSWSEYFFGAFTSRESAVFLDLPLNVNLVISVSLMRASAGMLSLQTAAFGMPVSVGDALYGATSDILDFSRIERDQFGNASLVKRKNVPVLNAQVFADKAKVPNIRTLRDQFAASPLVFLTVEDSSDDYFDALAMIGIFKRMPVTVEYPQHVLLNLECEGL